MYMYVETNLEGKKCAQNLVRSGVYWTRYLEGSCIGVGAGPADPVLAGSLFQRFNELCACFVHAYYSHTTSKVLPTPLSCQFRSSFYIPRYSQ